jgi:hypothetical protein
MSVALIEIRSFYWHFWLSPRVSYTLVDIVKSNFFYIADKRHSEDIEYCRFCCQLFHSSLTNILSSLQEGMTIPDIVWTPDSHFCHIVYSLGPYIMDYPEQALLACVVQGWCPWYVASDSCATYVLTSHIGVVVQYRPENLVSLASAAHKSLVMRF